MDFNSQLCYNIVDLLLTGETLVRYIAESEEDFQTLREPPPLGYLTLVSGGHLSHSFPLRGEIRLGREKTNAIVVADQKVSRYHAGLIPIDNTFILTDQGSANGTYINGVLIAQPTRLKDNDRITVGDTVFLFTLTQPAPDIIEPPLLPPPLPSVLPHAAATPSTGRNIPLWVLIGCMVLVIMALLFIAAILLGLLIGRAQLIEVTPLLPVMALL
jgi:hypothetical protein